MGSLTELKTFRLCGVHLDNHSAGFWMTPLISCLHGQGLEKLFIGFHYSSIENFCGSGEVRELDMLLGKSRFSDLDLVKSQLECRSENSDRAKWDERLLSMMEQTC